MCAKGKGGKIGLLAIELREIESEREKERTKKACPANYNRCQKFEVFKQFCE